MTPFTTKVIHILKNIPQGKVMTYGQVARCAGSPRGARQVVRILHSMSRKYHLPWHRVVNSKGKVSIQDDEGFQEQVLTLKMEGVQVDTIGRIELSKYQWEPDQDLFENLS